jgi:hypothetical protein
VWILDRAVDREALYVSANCRREAVNNAGAAVTENGCMITKSELRFSTDRTLALSALTLIDAGKGWCNVVPVTVDDVSDLKINVLGLWLNHGAPVATFVTQPPRRGDAQPSTLGVLHSQGRLGKERIRTLLAGESYRVLQDHNQRGLLLEVPVSASMTKVLDLMASMTATLCEYDVTDEWRLDAYFRA